MSGLVITLHIVVSLMLIGAILLQPGAKGGGLGSTFGGGGANSAFGAQGAAPFLAKATYWLAGSFMVTSLVIEILTVQANRSVLASRPAAVKKATPQQAPAQTPAAPATPANPAQK